MQKFFRRVASRGEGFSVAWTMVLLAVGVICFHGQAVAQGMYSNPNLTGLVNNTVLARVVAKTARNAPISTRTTDGRDLVAQGSGVILSKEGYIFTARHVIGDDIFDPANEEIQVYVGGSQVETRLLP